MTIVTCFNFAEAFCFATGWPGASGVLGKLDGIQYVGDNELCIDHIDHRRVRKLGLCLGWKGQLICWRE